MSIEKREESLSKLPLREKQLPSELNAQGTNLVEENYLWMIQDPAKADDPTVAVELHLTPLPGEKKRFLDIEKFSTSLVNYGGSDFPPMVNLSCQELSGFITDGINLSHIIATTSPSTVSSVTNAGGIIGYNVLYKGEQNPIWDITNVNTLTFKIKVGEEIQVLPSAQPLTIQCKITRVVF